LIPQFIGLVFTLGLFLLGVTSGYNEGLQGMIAMVLGGAYTLAVHFVSKLAHKIGYWNILVVPFIQLALVFVFLFFWLVMILRVVPKPWGEP